jgi:hypothetical protein
MKTAANVSRHRYRISCVYIANPKTTLTSGRPLVKEKQLRSIRVFEAVHHRSRKSRRVRRADGPLHPQRMNCPAITRRDSYRSRSKRIARGIDSSLEEAVTGDVANLPD